MKKLMSCLMAVLLAVTPLLAIAEEAEEQDHEAVLELLKALLPSYSELEGEPEIGT